MCRVLGLYKSPFQWSWPEWGPIRRPPPFSPCSNTSTAYSASLLRRWWPVNRSPRGGWSSERSCSATCCDDDLVESYSFARFQNSLERKIVCSSHLSPCVQESFEGPQAIQEAIICFQDSWSPWWRWFYEWPYRPGSLYWLIVFLFLFFLLCNFFPL